MITQRNLSVGLPLGFALGSLTRVRPRPKVFAWLNPYLGADNAPGAEQFHGARLTS